MFQAVFSFEMDLFDVQVVVAKGRENCFYVREL